MKTIIPLNNKAEYISKNDIVQLKLILRKKLYNKKILIKQQIKMKQIHAVLTYKLIKTDMVCTGSLFGCINRDKNSVLNIESILIHLINYKTKPEPFKRSNRMNVLNVNLSDASDSNITITEPRRESLKSKLIKSN